MSWRTVVISNSAKLDYQMGYMVVRRDETIKVHLSEMAILIIENTAVSLTAALLCELTKNKIKVIFCDEKRNPSSELVSYYGSFDNSAKIKKQIAWSEDIKTSIWTEIVSEKIRNQAIVLKEKDKPEYQMLETYLEEMEFGDATNREGHAAKVYFNALFGKVFSRTQENSTNAALNYGYGIILSCFTREITSNGYLTQLGLFHDNMFNQFNFACDLMEPFRPLVDLLVLEIKPQKFEKEEKMEVLKLLQREVVIVDKKELVLNAIKIYAKSVFDALNDCDTSLIKFFRMKI